MRPSLAALTNAHPMAHAYTALLAALALGAGTASAQNHLYVDARFAGADLDGTSWSTAYGALEDALADATAGDTILVRAGTYVAPAGGFRFSRGAALVGGFEGTETYATEADPRARRTVLTGDVDGNDPGPVIRLNMGDAAALADNRDIVLRVDNEDDGRLVRGFTIERAYFDPSQVNPDRSAVIAFHNFAPDATGDSSRIDFEDCVLSDNLMRVNGALITGSNSQPGDVAVTTLQRCRVVGNRVVTSLLGMPMRGAKGAKDYLVVANSEITGNRFIALPNGNRLTAYQNVVSVQYNGSTGLKADRRLALVNATVAGNPADAVGAGTPIDYIHGLITLDYVNRDGGRELDTTHLQTCVANSILEGSAAAHLFYNPRDLDVGTTYLLNNKLPDTATLFASFRGARAISRLITDRAYAEQQALSIAFRDAAAGDYAPMPCDDGNDIGSADLSVLAGSDFDFVPGLIGGRDVRGNARRARQLDLGAVESAYTPIDATADERGVSVEPRQPSDLGYQLVRCGADEIVASFRNGAYRPREAGDYYVRVDIGASGAACIWESDCVSFGTSAVDGDLRAAGITLAPNPIGEAFSVEAPIPVTEVTLSDVTGRVVLSEQSPRRGVATSGLPAGTYVARVRLADGRAYAQLVVKD